MKSRSQHSVIILHDAGVYGFYSTINFDPWCRRIISPGDIKLSQLQCSTAWDDQERGKENYEVLKWEQLTRNNIGSETLQTMANSPWVFYVFLDVKATATAQHRKLSPKMCRFYGQVCVYIYYNLATCINKTNPFAAFIKGTNHRDL